MMIITLTYTVSFYSVMLLLSIIVTYKTSTLFEFYIKASKQTDREEEEEGEEEESVF